jgi:hypothetical protein
MANSKPRMGARGATKVKTGCQTCKYDPTKLNALQLLLTRAIESGIRNAMRPDPRALNAAAPAVVATSVRVKQSIKSEVWTCPLNGRLG